MSRYIDAYALDRAFSKLRFNNDGELEHYGDRSNWYLWGSEVENLIADAPSIDLADYVPKEFHDKTCETMAKRHQEEIADILERADVDRPQGEWKPFDLKWGRSIWYCTACEEGVEVPCDVWTGKPIYDYCPNCGARMKGADDEEAVEKGDSDTD